MVAKPRRPTGGASVTPSNMPVRTPEGAGYSGDHSFTLQSVMELQKSAGQLQECINSLRSDIGRIDARMERLEAASGRVSKIIYAAGVVIFIAITVFGWIVNKAWNLIEAGLLKVISG